MAAVVVVAVTAAASAEAVAFVAAVLTVAFAVAGFTVPLTAVAFAAVGSTIAASIIGSSSLVILGTRSFTIPIHTTGIIPIAIILMAMDTAAFVATAFVAVVFAAVGDACMSLFSKAAADIPTLWSGEFSSVWLVETIIMVRSPDEEIRQSFFLKDWGIKVGLRRLY